MPRLKGNTIILLSALFFIISGCEPRFCCTNIDTGFTLSFVDQNGNDLLDPNHPKAITVQNIKLYFLIDEEMKRKYAPKYFSIITGEKLFDRSYMRLNLLVEGEDDNILTAYLEFEDNSIDTIKAQFRSPGGNSIYTSKIWYNGELRFDENDKSLQEQPNNEYVDKYFTVTHYVE